MEPWGGLSHQGRMTDSHAVGERKRREKGEPVMGWGGG